MMTMTDVTIDSGPTSWVISESAAASPHPMVTTIAMSVMRASLLVAPPSHPAPA